jgi:hypothetical protein
MEFQYGNGKQTTAKTLSCGWVEDIKMDHTHKQDGRVWTGFVLLNGALLWTAPIAAKLLASQDMLNSKDGQNCR